MGVFVVLLPPRCDQRRGITPECGVTCDLFCGKVVFSYLGIVVVGHFE